jgi:excisionase family DNA binding protein
MPQSRIKTLHTVQDVAKILNFSEEYVRRLLHGSKLPGIKFDSDWRINDNDLQDFIDGHRNQEGNKCSR